MIRKITSILAVALLFLGLGGIATASVAAKTSAAPAPAYGVCINVKGGVRVLEPMALGRSRHGMCRSTERKLTIPSVAGLPKVVAGKSAYEIWVTVPANVGKTETDFLASLKGKDTSLPAKFQIKFGGQVAVCTKGADAAGGIPAFECAPPAS